MANRWRKVQTVTDFIFLESRITADSDSSHKSKRCLLFGRKAMTNLDSILKGKDITLPTKICLVKAVVFPVVMYRCESWTIKKVERWGIDAFESWCWIRLLRVPWTARKSNKSILKEITPSVHWKEWCWIWSSNIWPLDAKRWLIGKDPEAGKERAPEKGLTENEMLDGITESMDMSLSKLREIVRDR